MDSLNARCGFYNARLVFRWLMDFCFHDESKIDDNMFYQYFNPQELDYGWTYWDNSPSVRKQRNGWDCGLYVLCYIECFFFKRRITSVEILMSTMLDTIGSGGFPLLNGFMIIKICMLNRIMRYLGQHQLAS